MTYQVEALAARLRCRLVKLSPGRLAAAAGVDADRCVAFYMGREGGGGTGGRK